MANIPLTLRLIKGSKLTFAELDNNFLSLAGGINNLPQNDSFVTGGTFNQSTNSIDFTGNYDFIPFSTDLSYLASDITVTGGTYNPSNGTVTFYNNSGGTFQVSGFLTGYTNYYTTGVTLNSTTLEFDRTDLSNAYSVDLSSLLFTGNTSATCISDLYVSNIHSCSPLNINPLDEGNVYFGSTSGVTIDLTNNRVGIGTLTPTQKLDVSGTSIFRDTVNMLTGTTILWQDKSGIFPTSVNNRIRWDLNSDSADIYAYQFLTTVDELNLVFKISDNNTTDSYVFWIDDFKGESDDSYPLQMDGQKAVFNALRRYATSATTSGAGNVDFYILRESATTLNDSAMFVDVSTGNVGIGTTTPTEKLEVNGKTKTTNFQMTSGGTTNYVLYSTDNNGNAKWGNLSSLYTGNTSATCISDLYVSNIHSCSPLNINPLDEGNVYFGSTSGITVDLTNVRLGVGTSSPTYKLQVNGTYGSMSYDPNRVRVSGDTDAGTFDSELILSGTTSGLTIINLVNGINSLGLISIGDDSGSTIYGNGGDTSIFNSSAARNLNIINSNGFGNDNIRFYAGQTASGTTPDIHIQGSGSTRGYVGIGTTSPSEKLDVSGKTKTINFQMTSGATNGYVLTSDVSGNASWEPLTVSSGIFGISNSGGVYTYYSTLSLAMSAATAGQTIEMFADVTETGNVTIVWKDGVNFNGNGHTYTHSYAAGNSNTINIPTTTVTCNIFNWKVIRTGRANGTTGDYAFYVVPGGFQANASVIKFTGVYIESTYGYSVNFDGQGGAYSGTLYSKAYLNAIMSYNNILDGLYGESTSSGWGLSNASNGTTNCTGKSVSGQGLYVAGAARNCIGISISGIGLGQGTNGTGPYYNCVGMSTSGAGGAAASFFNCSLISTSGIAGDGVGGSNNTLISSSNNAWYSFFPGYKITNSLLVSVSNSAARTRGSIIKNCVVRSEYNNAAGRAISEWFNDNVSKIINSDLEVANTSANCIYSESGSLNMKIAGCSYDGATTPVAANITQALINTEDNQGNILL
jgi:hypothetical protein